MSERLVVKIIPIFNEIYTNLLQILLECHGKVDQTIEAVMTVMVIYLDIQKDACGANLNHAIQSHK